MGSTVVVLALAWCVATPAARADVEVDVDWPSFLARNDPIWTQAPTEWFEAGFVGNGKLGALVSVDNTTRALQMVIGSTAVWDDRPKGAPYTASPENFACSSPRLPIGHFVLEGVGAVGSNDGEFDMRVRLWDAEATGSVGAVGWRVFAHAVYDEADVIVIELTQNTTTPVQAAAAAAVSWRFVPASFNRPWAQRACVRDPKFKWNPQALNASVQPDGATVVTQMHLRGTEHATAFISVPGRHGSTTTTTTAIYVSISDVRGAGQGRAAALAAVRAAAAMGIDTLVASHRQWWHAYYPRSFLTLAAPQIESFYWTQMYKIASATRADRPVYDLLGPWDVTTTSWPDIHWDLNLQMTYQPMLASNRLDLLESLTTNLLRTTPNLVANVPLEWRNDSAAAPCGSSSPDFKETCINTGEVFNGTCVVATGIGGKGDVSVPQAGNLLWVMHVWHQAYMFMGYDKAELAKLYPLLARAVTYYSHITTVNTTEDGGTGTLHLKPTKSPEYGTAPDANYDVALLRWGLGALLDAADTTAFPPALSDARLPLWRDMAARLTPFPVDNSTGFLIGDGVELAHGHRHFSHLFMIWPLKLLNLPPGGGTADAVIAARSLDHWISMGDLHGFSLTAIMPMSIMLGRKAAAFSNMTALLDTYITPNTMYYEGKGYPCGETPPAAAASLMDWMVMELQGVTRVFAGIDDEHVPDAAFAGLLVPGGFEVTARRASGTTAFVQVTNAAGILENRPSAQLALHVDAMALPWTAEPTSVKFAPRADGSGIVDVDVSTLPKGASVLFYSASAKPAKFDIVPSNTSDPTSYNYWGLPRGRQPSPSPPTSPGPPPSPGPPATHPCSEFGSVPPAGYMCFSGSCPGVGMCGTTLAEPKLDLGGGCSFAAGAPRASMAACAEAAAAACDVLPSCGSFALDPNWHGSTPMAKLFADNVHTLAANAGWTAWTKATPGPPPPPSVLTPARRMCRPGPPAEARALVIGDSVSIGQMDDIALYMTAHAPSVTVNHGPYCGDGGALDSKYAMNAADLMVGAGVGPPWIKGDSAPTRYGDGCLNATLLVSTTQAPLTYEVISFNFGIHDVEYGGAQDNDAYTEEWVPLPLYAANVRKIKRTLQATGAKVIFQSSTPVPYNLTTNSRIMAYNAVAKAVMAESPTAVFSDAYGAIIAVCGEPPYNAPRYPGSPKCSISDYNGVHYQAGGWQLLANHTASSILALMDVQNGSAKAARKVSGRMGKSPADVVVCNITALFADAKRRVAAGTAQGVVQGHSFDKRPWVLADAAKVAEPTSCPTNSTCMVTAFSNSGLGCCMGSGPNAVACADHAHCCPEGWTCEAGCRLGHCSCNPPASSKF